MRTTALRRRPRIDIFSSSKERSFLSFRASHTMNEDKYTTLIILMRLRWSCHLFNDEFFVNKFFVAFPLLLARKYRNIWTRKQLAKFLSSSFFLYFFLPFFAKTRNSIYRTLEKFRGRGKRRDEKFGRPITRSFIRAACQSPKSNERIFYLSREGRPT